MKYLIDNQLPPELARLLSSRGHDCQHVYHLGMASASDGEIWRFAQENGFVVISKDEDFFFLASRATSETQLVWIRLGNCRTSRLLTAIGAIWERVEARLQAGDQIVEIR